MEITVQNTTHLHHDFNYSYDDYVVDVEDHRILTIATECMLTASKWVKDVQKSHCTKHGTLLVGLCVDREHLDFTKGGVRNSPYDLLQLCVGSHCLLYHLPDPYDYVTPKFLIDFFSDPRVVVVGMDMESVAKKLDKDHRIKVKDSKDLRSLAIKGLQRDDLDLGQYDLDRLAKVVLGKHMDVVRPEGKVEWFDRRSYFWYHRVLNCEKVKYASVDPYLCFQIGSVLIDMIEGSSSSSPKKKKKENKKSKKKK